MISASNSDKQLPFFKRQSSKSFTEGPTPNSPKNEVQLQSAKLVESSFIKKDAVVEPKSPQHKRPRLRDYLFMANVCSTRNKEKKREINRTMHDISAIRSSKAELRQHKYQIPNDEMHKVISEQLVREFQEVISGLGEKKEEIQLGEHSGATKEDLAYLYEVRRIVQDKLLAALREIRDLEVLKQGRVIKEIYNMNSNEGNMLESFFTTMVPRQPESTERPGAKSIVSMLLPENLN